MYGQWLNLRTSVVKPSVSRRIILPREPAAVWPYMWMVNYKGPEVVVEDFGGQEGRVGLDERRETRVELKGKAREIQFGRM